MCTYIVDILIMVYAACPMRVEESRTRLHAILCYYVTTDNILRIADSGSTTGREVIRVVLVTPLVEKLS